MTLLTSVSCSGSSWTDAGTTEFENVIASSKTFLIDIRTPEEYDEGHLRGAVNIDWQESGFIERIMSEYKHGSHLAIYCRSGRRSAAAASKLASNGYKVTNLKEGIQSWTASGLPTTVYSVERFFNSHGEKVDITLIKHGSLELSYKGLSIQIDPVCGNGKPTDYSKEFPKADVVLITHEHGDHLDTKAINAIQSENTLILMNPNSQLKSGLGTAITNGQSLDLPQGVRLTAVPAYNTTAGREQFHPKGNGNGYLLSFPGELQIYVAGDTEDIPEMAQLKGVDVALLPVNQPYTMTVEQCVEAYNMIKPKVLIPYHFGQTDLSDLSSLLPESDVRIRDMQ